MPYRSRAQQRYMHARHPKLAKAWDRKYGDPGRLPEYVKGRKKPFRKT